MKFIKDLFITFSTRIAVVALTLGASIVVARVLGPEGKGAYSLIILVPTLLAIVGNLGIGIANAYFGGKKKYELAAIAGNSVISALGLGIILVVAFLVYFFAFQPSFLRDIEPKAVVLATIALPFSLAIIYFSYSLLGQNRIKEFNLVSLAQGGALLALILFFLFVIKLDVFNAIGAWASATVIASIFSILLVRRMTRVNWSFQFSLFKDSVKFGSQGYLGNVIQFLNYRLDMFLVALFMSMSFVGYYSVAVPLAEALWYFPAAVGTVIFARTIGLSHEQANKSTPRICRNTLFLTALAALLLLAVGKYLIILLFGSDFLPALQPLQILLPGVVALSICKVLGNEMAGRGKPIINTVIAAISLAINIPLNLVLIPRMGIAGAALASTISYTVSAIISIVIFVKISGANWVDLIILKSEDLRIYSRAFSGVYGLSLNKDGRQLALRQVLFELDPRSWGVSPEQKPSDHDQDAAGQEGKDTKG